MMKRELAEEIEQQYFDSVDITTPEENEGTKDMAPLLPFIISGGTNTEYYYFKHISKTTKYKFQIIPEYFGNESNHTNFFFYIHGQVYIFRLYNCDWCTIRNLQPDLLRKLP